MGKFIRIDGVDKFFAEIDKQLEQVPDLLVQRLQHIGESAVKEARINGAYKDQTGNLRSSIGYVILHDGMPIYNSGFQQVKDGTSGVNAGEALLQKLSAEFPSGYTLIVCAGMEYASYVEDIHGLNVLASARQLAAQLIRKLESKK